MAETNLNQFLRRQLFARHDDGRCVRIQLFHLGGKQRGVRTWPVAERVEESELEPMLHDVVDTAQQDAAELYGRQRYALCAYYERRSDQVAESKTFVRYGGGDEEEDDVDSEGPNQRGLLAQLMRHNEGNMRSVVTNSQVLLRSQGQIVESLSERLKYMEDKHLHSVQVYESLLSERHVRELASKEHELRTKAWGEGLDKLSLLAPVIINKLAGQRILPEPTTVVGEMVGGFVESISPEQVQKLGGVLTPEQMIVVLNLIDERRKLLEKTKAEVESRRLAGASAPSGNGATEEAKS